MRFLASLSVLFAVPLAAALAQHRPPNWQGSVDTLEGGTVLVRNPAASVWDSTTAWTLEEDLRIGVLDGPEPEVFGSIADVGTDDDGNIYVLESQSQEIRVFSPDGEYRFTIGRKGPGPGEFENATGLAWDDRGRLWVPDAANVRYSVFDSLGVLQTQYRRPLGLTYPFLGLFDASGRLLDLTASARPQELDLIPVTFFGDPPQFEYWPPITHRTYFGVAPQSIVMMRPRQTLAFSRSGMLWFGSTDAYRIYERTLEGDTIRIVEHASKAVELSESERESIRADLARWPRPVDPDLIPTHKPVFNRLVLDAAGYLFVNVSGTEAQLDRLIDVFDPEGRYLGRMVSPVRLNWMAPPKIADDQLLGVARDDMDVSYVVRLRLVRSDGS